MKPNTVALLGLLLSAAFSVHSQEPLPAPWKHQDIGLAQVPGTAVQKEGVFELQGTMDLWGVADGCHFAWQAVHGDVELVARVTAIDNPGGVAHAKASLCLRDSVDPGSRGVTLCVTPADGTQILWREVANGKTARVVAAAGVETASVPKGKFPCWLKLIRHGSEISGYESLDGQTWLLTGKTVLDLAPDAVIGMAASSHKKDILTKATFDHVTLVTGNDKAR